MVFDLMLASLKPLIFSLYMSFDTCSLAVTICFMLHPHRYCLDLVGVEAWRLAPWMAFVLPEISFAFAMLEAFATVSLQLSVLFGMS